MRPLIVALLLGCLALTAPAVWAADKFVPGTEDLPLMPGLVPVKNGGVVFDKPQGRIVEAAAKGKVTRNAVMQFYKASLPQLGWTAAGTTRFQREGEKLSLDFTGEDGNLTVAFTLEPQ